ncbi:MAG TPA: twin-arginine translocation signal domain-containing protein, partial [Planctomycetota bacterium]|nr:twin-arginine translocation signal domain-containing protein [Planctomycetota bacterium]
MAISRRAFLEQSSFAAAAAAVLGVAPPLLWSAALRRANIRVAATDWNLAQEGKIGAFALAKEAQLDGVQVSLGKNDEKKGE